MNQLLEIVGGILVFIIGGGWILLFIGYSVVNTFFGGDEKQTDNVQNTRDTSGYYASSVIKQTSTTYTYQKSGYDIGYEWAEEHDISDFSDCESIDSSSFGEGCQTYVDEKY